MNEEFQYNQPDPLYDDAVRHVREENRASVSFIQRRLRICYSRAVNLIERMENEGVVSPIRPDSGRTVIKPLPRGTETGVVS